MCIRDSYKAGKAALDKRLIDNELWFRMGHWKKMCIRDRLLLVHPGGIAEHIPLAGGQQHVLVHGVVHQMCIRDRCSP